MAAFSSSDDDVISGINVTPLVDVVLVLLVIFLITAPVLYQNAIKVQLPQAKTGEKMASSPLDFTIDKTGNLSWGKDAIRWDALGPRLAALGAHAADQTAIINADKDTPHGVVIRLMDALRSVGVIRFALDVQAAR